MVTVTFVPQVCYHLETKTGNTMATSGLHRIRVTDVKMWQYSPWSLMLCLAQFRTMKKCFLKIGWLGFFLLIFTLCDYFYCLYISVPQECLVSTDVRKGHWMHWKWSSRMDMTAMGVLGTELGSSTRTRPFNHWAISLQLPCLHGDWAHGRSWPQTQHGYEEDLEFLTLRPSPPRW